MRTDSLAIQLSNAVAIREGTALDPLVWQADVLANLHDALQACGWTVTNRYATGNINYPLGFPTVAGVQTTFPKRFVGCGGSTPFVSLSKRGYVFYDPYNEQPSGSGGCVFFALDTTISTGLQNLCNAINGSQVKYVASFTGSGSSWTLTLTAAQPGGAYNYPQFSADGRWGSGGDISGGGWDFTSVQNLDAGGNLRTASYTVRATSYGSSNPTSGHITRPIIFDISANGGGFGTALFYLDSWIYPDFGTEANASAAEDYGQGATGIGSKGYVIAANPYSFAILCPDTVATGIFAAAPYIPTEEDFTSVYAMFAVAWPTSGTWWDSGYVVALGGASAVATYTGTVGYPRMLAYRQPGTSPLTSPSGAPLVTNAWVMFGQSPSTQSYVVGKLWDCAMENDQIPSTEKVMIARSRYLPIASQDGSGGQTRSTLLFRVS